MKGILIVRSINFIYKENTPFKFGKLFSFYPKDINDLQAITPLTFFWSGLGTVYRDNLIFNFNFQAPLEADNFIEIKKIAHKEVESLLYFLEYLWFLKDNSISLLDYAVTADNGISLVNRSENVRFMADCKRKPTGFSLSELNSVEAIATKVNESKKYNKGKDSRLDRALVFLSIARESNTFTRKITFYIMIMECLFSANSENEIVHKIAERVAIFLDSDLTSRLIIFKNVKNLYAVRSKFVHGSNQILKEDRLLEYSLMADDYARKILNKIILNFTDMFLSDDESFTKWIDGIVLSGVTPELN